MMRAQIGLALCTLLGFTACGGTVPSRVVVGRFEATGPSQLWDQAVRVLVDAGYQPVAADAPRGTLVVPARTRGANNAGARFVLQLYREGWVQLSMAGPLVRSVDAEQALVPGALAQEYETLVFELLAAFGEGHVSGGQAITAPPIGPAPTAASPSEPPSSDAGGAEEPAPEPPPEESVIEDSPGEEWEL